MEDLFYSYPWISLATSTKANITLYMCNWQKFSAMAAKVWKEGKLQVTVWEQEPGMFSLGVNGKQSLHKRRGNMERKTASKLSLECIFLCFLCNVSLSAILLFQPFRGVIPLCTYTQSWLCSEHSLHCQSPFFYPNLYSKSSVHLIRRQRNFPESHFSLPTQCCLTAAFSCPAPPHLFESLLTLGGGLQGVAVFPLISSTSKRSQHYFCCQLCLCDRLWTIWMSLHLAAIKAPQFRTPHLGLPAPHRAELASPQRPELAHKHQTTSQNPISTSPEQQAAEEMLLSNLRVGCAQWSSPYLTNYSNLHR